MLLPISTSAKGVLWFILFGLAKTFQYGGLTILGVEGVKRLKQMWTQKPELNNIHIKEATIEQIPIIQQLANECYLIAYTGIHSEEQNRYMMNMMYSTESLRHQMTEEHSRFLLVYVNDTPTGYCAYKPDASEENALYIDKLYILPTQKGNGLGRLLVEKVMEEASLLYPHGYTIKLDVNRNNSAKSFYEHLGFSVVRSWDEHIGNGYYMNAYEMMYQQTNQ